MSRSLVKRIVINLKHQKYLVQINKRCVSVTSSRNSIVNNILCHPDKIEIPKLSLPEFIFPQLEPFADFVATECPFTHLKYTYGEIRKYTKTLSKVLRIKFGLARGDVALIYLPNCPQFPIAALACLEAGVVASTINPLYTVDELLRQINDASVKLIITTCDLHDNAAKAVAQLPNKIPIICVRTKPEQLLPRGAIDFTELININIDVPDLEPPSADDVAILPYSSGTTGLPKGVRLTHRNLVANLMQMSERDEFIEAASGSFQEVSPGVLPMFHIYGFTISTLKLMSKGAKIVTLPKFHPGNFIDVLKNYPVTMIFAAPPLILFLTHHPDIKSEDFVTLRNVMSGAAPLGATDEENLVEKVGKHVNVLQGYGLTETSPVVSMVSPSVVKQFPQEYRGSIGKVLLNTEVKIVKPSDPTATPLGPNEQGELLVRGPQVMQGYHNNPEATKGAFIDGWFRTGDLGYYNKNGLIFITDRVKELIKVKGFQVAPAELEEVLRSHSKIADAAVVGIPDEISGELPRAYIKPKDNVNVDLNEIYNFVASKVAKYKKLEGGIEVVNEIPKNPTGKILRRKLKEKYLAEQSH